MHIPRIAYIARYQRFGDSFCSFVLLLFGVTSYMYCLDKCMEFKCFECVLWHLNGVNIALVNKNSLASF